MELDVNNENAQTNIAKNNPGFAVRKRKIDMNKIQTVGKNILETAFSGSARNVLSSLGVEVLNSDEIEKNVIDQATTLSVKQTTEYIDLNELCVFSFPTTSMKTLNLLQSRYKDMVAKSQPQQDSSLASTHAFMRLKLQAVKNHIHRVEADLHKAYLQSMTSRRVLKRSQRKLEEFPGLQGKSVKVITALTEQNSVPSVIQSTKPSIFVSSVYSSDDKTTPQQEDRSSAVEVDDNTILAQSQESDGPSEPSQERCPVCDVSFTADMTLYQRTRHVEKCLSKRPSAHQKLAATKSLPDSGDEDLWEEEAMAEVELEKTDETGRRQANASRHGNRVDVRGHKGKRVFIDDGDDDFFFSMSITYMKWRQAVSECNEEIKDLLYDSYQVLANVINDMVTIPSPVPSESQMKSYSRQYFLTESAYRLPSGYIIPQHFYDVLYPYQRRGLQWLLGLHQKQVGGILADEMGLGKTVQVVAALVSLKFTLEAKRCHRDFTSIPLTEQVDITAEREEEEVDNNMMVTESPAEVVNRQEDVLLNETQLPSILIVPATLIGHWMRELRRWCPLLRCIVMHSMGSSVSEGTSFNSILTQCRHKHRYDVILTTYEGIKLSTLYRKQDWFYAILDEGGKIKNSNVEVSRQCKLLRTAHRLLISGTPLQNNLKELWSLMDFVYPGRLGTLEAFTSSFVIPISRGIYSNASAEASHLGYQCSLMLQETIAPCILRRLKQDVKKELPPKTEQVLSCLLSPQQEDKYMEYLRSEQVQSSLVGHIMPFKAIVRLRQICNHPVFYRGCGKSHTNIDQPMGDVILHHEEGMWYKAEYVKKGEKKKDDITVDMSINEDNIDYNTVDWRENTSHHNNYS